MSGDVAAARPAPPAGRVTRRLGVALVLAAVILSGVAAITLTPLKRLTLWAVVNACRAADAVTGSAWPCLSVTRTPDGRGIVVLKAPFQEGHVLVVPTARIVGLESPELAGDVGTDYLEAAWRVRRLAAPAGAHVGRSEFGLTINGPWNRTQDQLHVHVECLAPRASAAFATMRDAPTDRWVPLPGYRWIWVKRWPHPTFTGLDFRRDLYGAVPLPADRNALHVNIGAAGLVGPAGDRELLLIHSLGRSIEYFLDPGCE